MSTFYNKSSHQSSFDTNREKRIRPFLNSTEAGETLVKNLEKKAQKSSRLLLWYFLLDLLGMKDTEHMITWTDREKLEFRLVNAHDVSYLWGHLNGKENMTYAKFSRAIRYYYGKGVIEKIPNRRFCYRFIKSVKTKFAMAKVLKSDANDPINSGESCTASNKNKLFNWNDKLNCFGNTTSNFVQALTNKADTMDFPTTAQVKDNLSYFHKLVNPPHCKGNDGNFSKNKNENLAAYVNNLLDTPTNAEKRSEVLLDNASSQSSCSDLSFLASYNQVTEMENDLSCERDMFVNIPVDIPYMDANDLIYQCGDVLQLQNESMILHDNLQPQYNTQNNSLSQGDKFASQSMEEDQSLPDFTCMTPTEELIYSNFVPQSKFYASPVSETVSGSSSDFCLVQDNKCIEEIPYYDSLDDIESINNEINKRFLELKQKQDELLLNARVGVPTNFNS
ncbi:uncharacterized protein LOC130630343 [Hydractinia symbiolongicarpus]|uniref:uncharacterized protein LOC130630343 n=1 Tax=Hydractinia symbiolongicarpus TaxID=13093 RepID=UPI00254FFC84|nr:uncharacterized protein LOC130630343 [Hydractinia symbiolongicarpus]